MFQEVGLRFRLEFDMGNLEWVIWLVVVGGCCVRMCNEVSGNINGYRCCTVVWDGE